MFNQLLTPIGDSLILSFLVAALPIVVVLVSLGVLRRPAWQSSLAGLLVGLVIAISRMEAACRISPSTASRPASCSRSGR